MSAPRHRLTLTARQIRCLQLAAEGLTNLEIAQKVYMSAWSVKNDLVIARTALGARNTAHAVALGYRYGLIDIRPVDTTPAAALMRLANALGYDAALTRVDLPHHPAGAAA